MTRYAANTDVTSDRSRAEIEKTLTRYGADQFYGWQSGAATIGFRMHGRRIQFVVPQPDRENDEFRLTPSKKYIVLPSGERVGTWMIPQVERAYELGAMPPLLPMLDGPRAKR